MEKYSQWRDAGTGIAPFVPYTKPRQNIFVKLLMVIPKFLIFLLRYPIYLICQFFLLTFPFLSSSICSFILNYLFSLNFSGAIDISIESIKKSDLSLTKANLPKSGDFIIANWSSPLEVFIYYILSDRKPIFLTYNHKYQIIEMSFIQAFDGALSLTPNGKVMEFNSENYKNSGPIFFFPEQTTSNGKCILPYNSNFNSLINKSVKNKYKIKTIITKIPIEFTTPVPGSALGFKFKLLSNCGSLKIKVRMGLIANEDLKEIRYKSGDIGRLRLVGKELDYESKKKFVETYLRNTK